jgi:hypothetical protein
VDAADALTNQLRPAPKNFWKISVCAAAVFGYYQRVLSVAPRTGRSFNGPTIELVTDVDPVYTRPVLCGLQLYI